MDRRTGSNPAAPSTSEIATSLDEITNPNGGTKNIGGVKVTYVPQNGYRVTHKAPSGKELTTGYDSIEEAQQAVKFRLNRIKNGEIPAITESDENKITSTEYEDPGSAESKAWADRSKNERTATLVDWLDDWDKHPEEKNDAAYAAIEKELASRGVNRAGRQDAKKADNAGRNEFYRRAYESDAAPKIRQLTGDCKIRVRKA